MSLQEKLQQDGYEGYVYAYPHKTSYRHFESPMSIDKVWSDEGRDDLFLYVHLPFCEYRCGFCNLLTTANPAETMVSSYLQALTRQSKTVRDAIHPGSVGQIAIGGGTPSYLSVPELISLFDLLESDWALSISEVPLSFEVSPGTVDPDRLALLRERGVHRVSMGIQSFSRTELKALGRPHKVGEVEQACARICDHEFDIFNIDLIYGAANQTQQSWLESLRAAMQWTPQEVYMYPLYVRDLTGLGRRGQTPSERRRLLYQTGRDYLLSEGYEQVSMRCFRRSDIAATNADWCCQEDGMIGLGAGARSYTRGLHYSSEYAVGIAGVREIINTFCGQSVDDYSKVHYGVALNSEEQRRRYIIKSLLRSDGLKINRYVEYFDSNPLSDFPQLAELEALQLAFREEGQLRLTESGMARSDTIGPWLYSDAVQSKMEHYELT